MDIINSDLNINVYLFDIVETKMFQFPVNPIDSLKLKYDGRIETADILDIGEVDIFKDGENIQEINFNTILPFDYSAPYYKAGVVIEPETALRDLKKWSQDKKILRLMMSDMNLNDQVTISKLEHERRAGEDTVEGALKELATKDKDLETATANNKTELDGEIANLKQSVSSGKQLIATAVTGKDVPTNGSDSFQKMADNIDSIKTKLPILEGDVGVTEDNKGNVYDVDKIENRHTYFDMVKLVSSVWSYPVPSPYQAMDVAIDTQDNVYSINYSSGSVFKLSPDKEVL